MGALPFTSPSWPPHTQQLYLQPSFAQFISLRSLQAAPLPHNPHCSGKRCHLHSGDTYGSCKELPSRHSTGKGELEEGSHLTWQPDLPIGTAEYSLTSCTLPTTTTIPHPFPDFSFILSAYSQASSCGFPQAQALYFNHSLPYDLSAPHNHYNLYNSNASPHFILTLSIGGLPYRLAFRRVEAGPVT